MLRFAGMLLNDTPRVNVHVTSLYILTVTVLKSVMTNTSKHTLFRRRKETKKVTEKSGHKISQQHDKVNPHTQSI